MKALRFIFLALALLLQGGEAFATDPVHEPASCCCGDTCPCPMPPPATPRAPLAPLSQAPVTQAPAQAAPAQAPRVEPRPWSGLAVDVPSAESGLIAAIRPEPVPPGGRSILTRIATLRM